MSVQTESAIRLTALKTNIENKTGTIYNNLTEGINALINGYGSNVGVGDLPEVIQPGDIPIIGSWTVFTTTNTTDTYTEASITIPKTGTYRFRIFAWYSSSFSYNTGTTQTYPTVSLYKNGSIVDSTITALSNTADNSIAIDLECEEGNEIKLYIKGVQGEGSYGSYSNKAGNTFGFVACINK